METPRVLIYTPTDQPSKELAPDDIFGLVRVEEINRQHTLEITTTEVLRKEMRVLTSDHTGKWHEWVVMGEDEEHSSGLKPVGTYFCVWSLQHDLALTKVDAMPGVQSPVAAQIALDAALSGTNRWSTGTVTRMTTGGASMWYKSGWEALSILVKEWGGEIDATIRVGEDGVVSRSVDLYDKMGNQDATRRFDWGSDMSSMRRKVADAPMAVRIIPRGKGEETDAGGYGRKVTIESVNDGIEWLQNDETAPLYRLPDGNGGWEYPTIIVENGSIEDPAELKAWGLSVISDYTEPKVTYESGVKQFAQAGMDVSGVSLGDATQCVDRGFSDEGLRITGRVVKMVVNELDDSDVTLTLGYLEDGIAGRLAELSKIRDTVKAMNGGTLSTADYLISLLNRLNTEINMAGGYTYVTNGQGLRTYDKAVSDPLVGREATKAVEIKGGTIRIADSKTSAGEWDWKTVFTSGHIASEMITAAQLTTGFIRSADGKSYWNLDANQLVTVDMTAVNITGTGTFTSSDGNKSLRLKTGELTAFRNGKAYTRIGISDEIDGLDRDTGRIYDLSGTSVESPENLIIRAKNLAVGDMATHKDVNLVPRTDVTAQAFTGSVRIDKAIPSGYVYGSLHFVNGILIGTNYDTVPNPFNSANNAQ